MKIVVTGALGHIGSKLIRDLPKNLHQSKILQPEIVLLDNFYVQRYCSLFNLPSTANYSFFEEDVTKTELTKHFKNADVVIHLAAITNATESFQNKELVEKVNFNATKSVAEAAIKCRVPLIYISTSSVYGTSKNVVSENCDKEDLKPQSPYAETKLKEEELIQSYSKTKGLKSAILRFGTIYGVSEGMRFHTAVNKFVFQAVMGIPLTVWSKALHQVRPYLDLEDAVGAISFVIKNKIYTNEVYNILTQNSSVNEIVETIKIFIPNLEIKLVDSDIMNQLSYRVLNSKFQSLGFKYQGDLKRQIEFTINLLKNANSNNFANNQTLPAASSFF